MAPTTGHNHWVSGDACVSFLHVHRFPILGMIHRSYQRLMRISVLRRAARKTGFSACSAVVSENPTLQESATVKRYDSVDMGDAMRRRYSLACASMLALLFYRPMFGQSSSVGGVLSRFRDSLTARLRRCDKGRPPLCHSRVRPAIVQRNCIPTCQQNTA
jgi:hypothetical protein